ncbi:MAG TPA: hypothetical protein PK440_20925, partial [Candidatus Accumulibacter phosphatis]|nr:hypothetical protein [Candidatus Accumulibacter phosphatis]
MIVSLITEVSRGILRLMICVSGKKAELCARFRFPGFSFRSSPSAGQGAPLGRCGCRLRELVKKRRAARGGGSLPRTPSRVG